MRGRNTPSEKGSDHRIRRRVKLTGKLHCDRHRPIAAESPHIEGREIGAKHVTVVRGKVRGATQSPNSKSTRGCIMTEN